MMNQPGVVPNSDKYLDAEDPDGNQLWRLTCMREQVVNYIKVMKKNGFLGQEFHYDSNKYVEDQKLISKLKVDQENVNLKIMNMAFYNFQELFQNLLHLKIMRVFVDGVLRYGIPPKFYMAIVKPNKMGEKKIMDKMLNAFAEDHLKEMYGQKENAQDEDFFPYVSNSLTSPMSLN